MTEQPSSDAMVADQPVLCPTIDSSASTNDSSTCDCSAILLRLEQLETCLRAGHRAVLARDVAAIECATAEQKRLEQGLKELLPPSDDRREGASSRSPHPTPWRSGELRAAAERVLQLGRVHLGLIRRAGRSLHILSQLMAGPGANYAPPRGTPASSRIPPGRS